jgi:hypothetical protein
MAVKVIANWNYKNVSTTQIFKSAKKWQQKKKKTSAIIK